MLKCLNALNEFALQRGDTLAQLALRWVLQHEYVTSVIVGASRVEQLADSLKCVDHHSLSIEELSMIDQLLKS